MSQTRLYKEKIPKSSLSLIPTILYKETQKMVSKQEKKLRKN